MVKISLQNYCLYTCICVYRTGFLYGKQTNMATNRLEVFYSIVEREVSSSDDALVALIHWLMIQNGYVCIGSGETVS